MSYMVVHRDCVTQVLLLLLLLLLTSWAFSHLQIVASYELRKRMPEQSTDNILPAILVLSCTLWRLEIIQVEQGSNPQLLPLHGSLIHSLPRGSLIHNIFRGVLMQALLMLLALDYYTCMSCRFQNCNVLCP